MEDKIIKLTQEELDEILNNTAQIDIDRMAISCFSMMSPIHTLCDDDGRYTYNVDTTVKFICRHMYYDGYLRNLIKTYKGVGGKDVIEVTYFSKNQEVDTDINFYLSAVRHSITKCGWDFIKEEVYKIGDINVITFQYKPKSDRYYSYREVTRLRDEEELLYYKNHFIERASKMECHKDIDYSLVEYVDNRTPVKLIDHSLRPDGTEYGVFWQTPSNHLKGQGHPDKRGRKISKTKQAKQEDIIRRFREVHKGENLDYSQVEYDGMHVKVKIISHDLRPDGTEYGEFWQEPAVHLKGCTHPEIGKRKSHESQRSNTEEFVEKAKIVHCDDDYDYSKVDYKGSGERICIICNKIGSNGQPHGEFYIRPDNFLQGKGCMKCANHHSYAEDEIAEIVSGFDVIRNDRKTIKGKELDIYIPSKNIAIEYHGLRWHSEGFGGKDRNYHLDKLKACNEKGIRLMQIFEDEYRLHKELVIDKIKHCLGLNNDKPRLHARDCFVVEEKPSDELKDFFNRNHIQGYAKSTVTYGLRRCRDWKLVGAMQFTRTNVNSGDWSLVRYATDIDYICNGFFGKLLKFFREETFCRRLTTFADRRWTLDEHDNLYTKVGFKLDGFVPPTYTYYNHNVDALKRFHKFGFRKEKLHKKYGLPMTMTEKEMTKQLGYDRIWDCGLIRYVKDFWEKT